MADSELQAKHSKPGQAPAKAKKRKPDFEDYGHAGGRGWIIATCLVLSALLWLAFSLRRPTSVTLRLPTRVVNLPANQSLSIPAPDSVEYIVSGEAISILPVYYNRPVVEIDAALQEVDFEIGGVTFPGDIRVDAAVPRRYTPVREERVSTRVPIVLRAALKVPATHAFIVEPYISPDSVVISGAQSVIDRIQSWPTRLVSVPSLTDSLDMRVELADSLDGLVRLARPTTRLRAIASEFTQGVRHVDIRLTGAPVNQPVATLEPARVAVSFRLPVEYYQNAMNSAEFYATVPYDLVRGDTTGRVTPILNIPANLNIKSYTVDPPMVRYFNILIDQ